MFLCHQQDHDGFLGSATTPDHLCVVGCAQVQMALPEAEVQTSPPSSSGKDQALQECKEFILLQAWNTVRWVALTCLSLLLWPQPGLTCMRCQHSLEKPRCDSLLV